MKKLIAMLMLVVACGVVQAVDFDANSRHSLTVDSMYRYAKLDKDFTLDNGRRAQPDSITILLHPR